MANNANSEKFIRFKMDKDWARNLLDQPGVEYAVKNKTEEVLRNAKSIARAEAYDTGKYHNSFRADYTRSNNDDRLVGHVINDDPKWLYIEYGTRYQHGKHIIKRAVQNANLGSGRFGGR